MASIKDRNGMDLTEAEDIKKTWQEYTEELYKKDLHNRDNHDGVITDLEPDILECEGKWALWRSSGTSYKKASGSDEIAVDQTRQHIKKQRCYFANKDLCSESYGFSQ